MPDARASLRVRVEVRILALQARLEEQGGDLIQAIDTLRRAHITEVEVLRAEAEQRTRDLTARSELERDRQRLETEQARYAAERAAKEQLEREQTSRLQELERLALYDALTGLPNRLLLSERARTALREAAARNMPLAVGVMDLNKFKAVNDTYGHHVGDLLLKEVATGCRWPWDPDTVARTGGDEFVFLLAGGPGRDASGPADGSDLRRSVFSGRRLGTPDIVRVQSSRYPDDAWIWTICSPKLTSDVPR